MAPALKFWDGTQYVPILGGISQGDADARYVKQTGDSMSGGLGFGSAVATAPTDVTRHVALYGAVYGFSVTPNTLNYVAPANYFHHFHGKEVSLETPGSALRLAPAEGTPNRYLMMRDASNGNPGVRFTQDAAGTLLAPLGVLDPSLPEHAATKAYVDTGSVGTLVAATGWALWTATDTYCVRSGSTVVVGGTFKRTGANLALAAGSQYQFASLPSGFRPTIDSLNCWGMNQLSTNTAGSEAHIAIYPDGRLILTPHTAGTINTNQWVIFNGSFYVG